MNATTQAEFRAAVLKARIGRRVRLAPDARRDHRRRQNNKAATACRQKRIERGLRADGKPRKHPVRVSVVIKDVGFVENDHQWIQITEPSVRLSPNMPLLLIFQPRPGRTK